MSDGDVSLIQDEDVLRRMWQQTEDFSRKKEIRAHMYRLREQRLRNLYAAQTQSQHHTKGLEGAGSHVSALLDQSFQGLKSKEVRDAASPPKVFHGPDLKELSNAGWNVESENRTTDDGHTRIRSVQANIEGRYDVEGGAGQFTALDQQKQAITEYQDDHSNLKRNESSTNSAAQEQVLRKTDNGVEFSSTKSSSSASQFREESSTRHEVPYHNDDYDVSRNNNTTNQNSSVTNTSSYEQSLRKSDIESGELISRKVDYPDDNTKITVETRCLPDGTRVTSTRREFRAPVQSTKSEQRSQTSSEMKSSSQYSTTSQQKSDIESHRILNNENTNIVDSQRYVDDYDFKRNKVNYFDQKNEREESQKTYIREDKRIDKKESSSSIKHKIIGNQDVVDHKVIDHKDTENYKIKSDHQNEYSNKRDDFSSTERHLNQQYTDKVDEVNKRNKVTIANAKNIAQSNVTSHSNVTNEEKEIKRKNVDNSYVTQREIKDVRNENEKITKNEQVDEVVDKVTTKDQYQTTYQSDYTQKKISNDWSPSHQAWASTLRTDTPLSTRSTTRASSPTYSLRSSVSPDKTYRKPSSRGGSPTKSDHYSHTYTDKYSSKYSTSGSTNETRYISPDRKPPRSPARSSPSPDRKHPDHRPRPSQSPEKRPQHQSPHRSSASPEKHIPRNDLNRQSPGTRPSSIFTSHSPDRKTGHHQPNRSSVSPDRKPGYMRTTESQNNRNSPMKHVPSPSPERKFHNKITSIEQEHYKFIDEETKMYSRTDRDHFSSYSRSPDRYSKSPSPLRSIPDDDSDSRSESPIRPTLRKTARSPSPPKGPVTFTKDTKESIVKDTKTSDQCFSDETVHSSHISTRREQSPVNLREESPSTHGTYDKKQRRSVEKSVKSTENHRYDSTTRRDDIAPDPSKPAKENVSPDRPSNSREFSPPNYGTYDKNRRTEKDTTKSTKMNEDGKYDSSTRHKKTSKETTTDTNYISKSPRRSVSPVKSPARDNKYKHTTDFLLTETTIEESDKKTKNHPRQLVTPSTSPARKPKVDDTAPSTEQSSPTTSVSGFVYYSSSKSHEMVTDLDDVDYYSETKTTEEVTTTHKRPETLPVDKRLSPSKIPCRSPSPEKTASPTKDNPLRKSSLKKTSTDCSPVSPTEKPPSSFRISPENENYEVPEHKVVKKDRPDKPEDSPVKPKPPLERRETYEDRCRKILGMTDDINSKTVKRTSSFKEPKTKDTIQATRTEDQIQVNISDKTVITKTNVTNFITNEKMDTVTKTVREKTPVSTKSPSRESSPTKLQNIIHRETTSPNKKPSNKISKESTPTRSSVSPDRKPGLMKTTSSTTSKTDTTNETLKQETSTKILRSSPDREVGYRKPERPSISPVRKPTYEDGEHVKKPSRSSISPDREPGYMKSTQSTTIKNESIESENIQETTTIKKLTRQSPDKETGYHILCDENVESKPLREISPSSKPRSSVSPDRKPSYMKPTSTSTVKHMDKVDFESISKVKTETDTTEISKISKTSRLPSPTKATHVTKEEVSTFIESEREQEIFDKVQKSLRKLSPAREHRSPSREKSPEKTTISLQDLDIINETIVTKKNVTAKDTEQTISKTKPSKMPLRNVSPTKKPPTPTPTEKSPDSPTKSVPSNKSRSISPKKPVSPTERPPSPHVSKPAGAKPRESTPTQLKKSPSGSTVTTKIDKTIDSKITSQVTKQNSFSKTQTTSTKTTTPSPTRKTDYEPNRATIPKSNNKENINTKKEDIKVTRTASDAILKTKKTSPQRVKSKPEIQVNDLPNAKTSKPNIHTNKLPQKSTKLAPKPKSATALNTSVDEDDVLIDVEQAKSSRENSPDRICPTPVNFADDLQTPRYPDEVNEPDDDFCKRTHHIIHETETIVDDIVEIDEEDELFVKKTDIDRFTESDECLLSVTDKVSKFANKIETVTKPKESSALFKDVDVKKKSDFMDENLQSDECLLSVSEKVNRFAKGHKDTKDSRSPTRRIVDEYDVETVYQDDYTKLSVNDKAHLFIETVDNINTTKTKPSQKMERPDLSDVDDNLKSDECMLSVSDKVNKFVKTAEQFLNESNIVEDKKVKEEYEKFMQKIVGDEDTITSKTTTKQDDGATKTVIEKQSTPITRDTKSSQSKAIDSTSSNLKKTERAPTVKITTLRSSEAVKKAKALFENIATTQQSTKTTKLTDIGVVRKSPKPDSNGDVCTPVATDEDDETDLPRKSVLKEISSSSTINKSHQINQLHSKSKASPTRLSTQSPEIPREKSPMLPNEDTKTTKKSVLSRYPAARQDTIKNTNLDKQKTPEPSAKTPKPNETKQKMPEPDHDKPQEKTPGYLRSTKKSHMKQEKPVESVEETEIISTRRGSGKFGVELRKTSVERMILSNERRRSSTEHHQPCIEDIFDLGLLEQMLEKVVGYEQRRRIRAQIRVVKKKMEIERTETTHSTKITKHITLTNNKSPERRPQTKSPERRPQTKSPERQTKSAPQKTLSPERQSHSPSKFSQEPQTKPLVNGHAKEPNKVLDKRQRTTSPEKHRPAQTTRQPSPEKKTRTTPQSPATHKSNRFNEYASAYMKKVGLNDSEKIKVSEIKTKKSTTTDNIKDTRTKSGLDTKTESSTFEERVETKSTSTSKSFSERTSSKDTIEIVKVNGKRSMSPEKKRSPDRHAHTERLAQRSPSPDFKRTKTSDTRETISSTVDEQESPRVTKRETIIKTVVEERPIETKKSTIKTAYEIEKKTQPKQVQEEKPTWVTNRNLKKTSSESRSYSSKKVESEKTKYRAVSPSKVISKPLDVITSSYGPGPLDADGRPLFGIKALRNGASNYQVKGTVIRQEFHSRNGGEPEGSVSVTAYSTEPEDLERLLRAQGERPSRLHGLAAITTTKKFGGDTGASYKEVCTKEERASLEQFTHSDRKVADSRIESVVDRVTDKKDMRTIECVSDTREQRTLEKSSPRTEVKSGRERREDRTAVRQSSVKNLTEKYIKSASGEKVPERSAYPKAGLILRTAAKRDSLSSDSSNHAGLCRSDSAYSLGSEGEATSTTTQRMVDGATVTSTTTTTCSSTRRGDRSFLDSSSKVTGVQDILTRMKNADIVIQEGDSNEDSEARALLNKFLGATVLMAGMQGYVQEGRVGSVQVKESVRSSESKTTSHIEDFDPDQCWDERVLRKYLEESSDYEQRRRLRARIRTLMAEQEACASAVTEALGAAGVEESAEEGSRQQQAREEEEVTVTSSVRRDSSEKTVSSSTTTKTSKVIESVTPGAPKKPVSPFAKFRQLEKQNSTNSPPNSAKTPQSPGSGAPYFKFTDPALQTSAATIKERLLQWCRDKTRDYENVKLENFSTSWADGLAFCALIHHFLPDAFDYSQLTPDKRRHNFTLAFKVADEKAGIYPLLDVDDMVAMRKPDWKCVFTYVQAIHRRFKDQH